MLNKDGTGPEGKGSRTGRQLGKCTDAKPCPVRRQGRGLGRGRNFQED
ncbi:MAG: DUF5320 domain-containing protein [archaeon]|nr:DUF5320 domain-containing protein [Nanoarchaeota archaeon]